MASFKRKTLRVFLLLVLFFLGGWVIWLTDTRQLLRDALQRISDLGPWAPFWFIVAYILACVTFFPGVILTLGAGILFGLIKGTFYVSIGATIGAGCAFLLSRYVARKWVMRKFGSNEKFRAIDDAVEKEGWKIVGLIRLSPVFPFIPMNFVFGLTKVPFLHFVFVTWIGIIPITCLFVYLGTLIGDIAALGTRPIASGTTKWVVTAIGIVATVIVTVFITRIARRALARRLPEAEDS
jgi:uncharacterized membrane protein YdjX (TVP38/TMEM64 family)